MARAFSFAQRRPAPVQRGQGNLPFRSEEKNRILSRGQYVPYDVNGAPTVTPEPGFLSINISNLPAAAGNEALYEFIVPPGADVTFNGNDEATAFTAATAPASFTVEKNYAPNGSIDFVGAAGTVSLTDSSYAAGDVFTLYSPSPTDATLDRVSISLGTD
jgi:hypothetical protein